MQKIETSWEDEENNRQVAFAVEYVRKDDAIEIQAITPKQVTFLCPQSSSPLRSIGVWTDKGRQLLSDQFRASGQMNKLVGDIDSALAV